MPQNKPVGKDLRLGDFAPDFTAKSTKGEINFYRDTNDSWAILLCYPDDFSPVATTELALLSKLHQEFTKRNVQLLALATHNTMVDGRYKSHDEWVRDVEEVSGAELPFPIIEDERGVVSHKYGVLDDEDAHFKTNERETRISRAFESRAVFVIGPKKQIRMILNLPAHIGLNTAELFRLIDGLQTAYKVDVRLPANWIPGGDIMIPRHVSNADAKKEFGQIKEVKPYLRFAPLPIEATTFQAASVCYQEIHVSSLKSGLTNRA